MKYTLQQPGRSIYKLEQLILKIFKFSIADDYRLSSRVGQRTRFLFVFFFGGGGGGWGGGGGGFGEKMVQSAAIKLGRSANRKHTYFFFFCLSGSYNISPQIKISHLFNTGGRVALSYDYF